MVGRIIQNSLGRIVCGLGSIGFAFGAVSLGMHWLAVMDEAESSIHQIYGALMLVAAILCAGFSTLLFSIPAVIPAESTSQPAVAASPTRYQVRGVWRESGKDISVSIPAESAQDAEDQANGRGIMVSSVDRER